MKQYSVEKSQHDFKPNDQPLFTWATKCDWEFRLTESMWYSREDPDYPYGDYNGWNKLGFGFTRFFSKNDQSSCMIAYFPDEANPNRFNIVGYTNDKHGNWDQKFLTNVGLEEYEGSTIWLPDSVVFKIRKKGSASDFRLISMDCNRGPLWLPRRGIGGYFGGRFPWFRSTPAQYYGSAKYK